MKTLSRGPRIALELLAPPPLGAVTLFVASGIRSAWNTGLENSPWKWDPHFLASAAVVLFFAYLMAGIQSILYRIVLEWQFSRGLSPRSWRAVGLSTLLGFASGALIAMVSSHDITEMIRMGFTDGGLGAFVGFTLGLAIRAWSAKSSGPPILPTSSRD